MKVPVTFYPGNLSGNSEVYHAPRPSWGYSYKGVWDIILNDQEPEQIHSPPTAMDGNDNNSPYSDDGVDTYYGYLPSRKLNAMYL